VSSIPPIARIVVRPYGSALPLGFFSFGIGMALLGALGLGWIPPLDAKNAGLVLVLFVFPLELLATIIAFLARDTTGATALGLFSASWLYSGYTIEQAKPGETSHAFGIFLLTFAIVAVLLGVAAVAAKPLIAGLLIVASARSASAGLFQLTGTTFWDDAGGVLGLVIAAVAFYGGLALLLEDGGNPVLPLFRRGDAHLALEGSLADQLAHLENEPGVRDQL
jgi:succinate-acetate transporter protein